MPAHTSCRICDRPLPEPFFDLGAMPLANAFLADPSAFAAEPRYPLAVSGCGSCGLVQLTFVVPAEELYRDYIYVSSTSDAVRAHAERLAAALSARYAWTAADLVVEVASNDGTVLQAFRRRGLRVLGVEPARNIAALASAAGVPTMAEFFNLASARAIVAGQGRAAAIVGRHVLAHVDDLHEFFEAVDLCLADDGVFVIEVPYLGDLLERNEFDTIYHEHLSYFSLGAVERLARPHGFALVDVESIALHGGSVILHLRRLRASARRTDRAERCLARESAARLSDPGRLRRFADDVGQWKERFEALIVRLEREGARLVGYGAAAKANTLLNYCPAAARTLGCVLDRSRLKHGRYTPGTRIRVAPADQWNNATPPPTHMLVLAWNFKDEIMRQMQPFADAGGRFVIPIPEPTVL